MEVSTFERIQRLIWDHLLPFKAEIIQKQALFLHQSIPAVPIPPGNRGAFAHVVSPGGGAFAILSWLRGLGISIPGRPPGI